MRGPRALTDVEIVALYAAGYDSDSIGYRASCSGTTVLKIVREAGLPIRGPGTRSEKRLHLTSDQIIARYLAGESALTVAQAAGCVPSTIYNVLRRAGHRPRPRIDKRRGGKFSK